MEVHRNISVSLDEEENVRKQLSLCRLNRSLCHFNLVQYEDALDCCKYVAQDRVSDQQAKCKAIIRMGQCFYKMASRKGVENKSYLLTSGMECASKAERMVTDDDTLPRDLLNSIKMLQKQISAKLPAKVDNARGLNSLPSVSAALDGQGVLGAFPVDHGADSAALRPPAIPLPLPPVEVAIDASLQRKQATVFRNMQPYMYDICLKLVSSASASDRDSGILSDAARLCLLVRLALYIEHQRSLHQRLPRLGQLAFPSKLLRRFLRGCVVFTVHGLVTAPASVYVDARKKKILINRIVARVMSGAVVREEGRLQATAAHRIAGQRGALCKIGLLDAASCGDVDDVLSYLIADANCVNKRDR